jgi:2-aminoadipate transaminase
MQLSKAAQATNQSFVRNILALTQKPGVISFAGGLPDPLLFPTTPITNAIEKLLAEEKNSIFQYGPTAGFLPLREILASQYQDQGVKRDAQSILITQGSQQGLDILIRALLNPGDSIVVEAPTYLAALQLFQSSQATIHEVPLHSDGPDINMLENLFKKGDIRFFYTVPTFQNPTGFTCKAQNRQKIAGLARQYGVCIIEDDPYGALRYEGQTLPSYATFWEEGTAILGTASKIAAPDFRLGWLSAPTKLHEACLRLKGAMDLQSGYFFQRVFYHLLENGTLRIHKNHLIRAYRQKRDLMVKALQENFKDTLHVNTPQGGMFLWANFNDGTNTMELFERAIKEHVAYVPGSVFYAKNGGESAMRLNFTHASLEKIQEGVERLKKAHKN